MARWWGGLTELNEVNAQRQIEGAVVGTRLRELSAPLVVAGDFNLTTESAIYQREFAYLQNAFSRAGFGYGGTKYTRHHNVRIDHILSNAWWRVHRCEVVADVGSDHRPVIAELELLPQGSRDQGADSPSVSSTLRQAAIIGLASTFNLCPAVFRPDVKP